MESSTKTRVAEILKNRKYAKRWLIAFLCLAVIAGIGTFAALKLNGQAVTKKNRELDCAYQVHTHTDECYADVDGQEQLVCGYADYVVHIHNDDCYDENGSLVCPLPEIEPHIHDDSCYTVEQKLVCGQEESPGHTHDETCFDEEGNVICGQEESEGHVHSDACYAEEKTLVCGKLELHTHTDECYGTDDNGTRKLVCGLLELKEHEHEAGCFKEVPEEPDSSTTQQAEEGLAPGSAPSEIYSTKQNSDAETQSHDAPDQIPATIANSLYSSDLTDFLSSVGIRDAQGKEIEEGGNIYIGDSYTVTLTFKEEKGGTQFAVDKNGNLTYQLPGNFKALGQGPNELKVGGEVVGTYTIDDNGLITVTFNEDGAGKYYFDNFQDTAITITLDTQAQPSTSSEGGDFGGGSSDLEWNVTGDPELSADKQFQGYNVVDDTISYTVDVTPSHGDMKRPKFKDTLDKKTELLGIDKVTITDKDGHTREVDKSHYTVKQTDDGFELTVDQEVKNGETLHVEYRGKVKDSAKGENGEVDYTDDNYVYIYDETSPDVHIEDSTSKYISDFKIHKTGWPDETSAGDKVIGWDVQILAEELGDTIKDTLGDGLSFYLGTNRNPHMYFYDANGKQIGDYHSMPFSGEEVTISKDGKTATFDVPDLLEGTAYVVLEYYTYYDTSSGGVQEFTNTAATKGISDDATVKTAPDGVTKNVLETYIGADGREYIEYRVDAGIPAGPYPSKFYLCDKLRFYNVNGQTYYADNVLTDITVFVTKENGEIITLKEYDGGGTKDTYSHYKYNHSSDSIVDNNGYYTLLFNCKGDSRTDSNWPYEEATTLSVVYSIPLDIAVQGADGTMSTVKELLDRGFVLNNKATVNLDSAGTEMEDDVDYADPSVTKRLVKENEVVKEYDCGQEEGINHHHTAECNEKSYIDYTVTFKNWDGLQASNSADQIIPDPRSMIITDKYDPDVLEFVEVLGINWDTPKRDDTEAAFTYKGTTPVTEEGTIKLDPRDFVMTGGSKKSSSGNYWSGYKYHELDESGDKKTASLYECMWGRSDAYLDSQSKSHKDGYTLVLKYRMRIKDEILKDSLSSYVTADNTVAVDFGPDCGAEEPVYRDSNHLEYNTGMMGKNVGDIEGNRVPFTIYLNSERKTLTDGNMSIDLKDIMSTNLSLDWNSVKVEAASYDNGKLEWHELEYPKEYTKFYDTDEMVDDGRGGTYPANILTVHGLPDATYIRVSYETIVVGIGSVRVTNRAELNGKAVVQDSTDATFDVNNSSGGVGGSTDSFTLIKQDAADSSVYLPGAKFDIYLEGQQPAGLETDPEKFEISGKDYTAYKIGSLETDANGSAEFENQYLIPGRTYIMVETQSPEGYNLPEEPFIFVYGAAADSSTIKDVDASSVYSVLIVDNDSSRGKEIPVKIKKVDMLNTTCLKGAEISIYGEDYDPNNTPTSEALWTGKTGEDGLLVSNEGGENPTEFVFESGHSYYLVEDKAPDGYNLLKEPVLITVHDDGKIEVKQGTGVNNYMYSEGTEIEILVYNSTGYELPESGGYGTTLYTLSGLLLIAAFAALMYKKNIEERRSRSSRI